MNYTKEVFEYNMFEYERALYQYLVLELFRQEKNHSCIWDSKKLDNFVDNVLKIAVEKYNCRSTLSRQYILYLMKENHIISEQNITIYRVDNRIFDNIRYNDLEKLKRKFYTKRKKDFEKYPHLKDVKYIN